MIAYINGSGTWNREARTFALTTSAYPGLDLTLSRDHAVTTLITAYFHRYGPATIRDATWWSGLSASDITAALRRSGRELIDCRHPVERPAVPDIRRPGGRSPRQQRPDRDTTAGARGLSPQGLLPDPRPLPRRATAAARLQPDRRSPAHHHHRRNRHGYLVMGHPRQERCPTGPARQDHASRTPPDTPARRHAHAHAPCRPQHRFPRPHSPNQVKQATPGPPIRYSC